MHLHEQTSQALGDFYLSKAQIHTYATTVAGNLSGHLSLDLTRANTGFRDVTDTLWDMRFASDNNHMFNDVFGSDIPAERKFTDLHHT